MQTVRGHDLRPFIIKYVLFSPSKGKNEMMLDTSSDHCIKSDSLFRLFQKQIFNTDKKKVLALSYKLPRQNRVVQ